MPISVRCPNESCGTAFNVPDAHAHAFIRCRKCKTKFPVDGSGPPSANPADTQGASRTISPSSSPKSAPDLPEIIGRFHVKARLGEGAFGAVYRAHDPQLDREVALKVPRAGALQTPRQVERFLREARAAAQLRHPHIVPIHDAGEDGGLHYIAAAFIPGCTLAQAIDEEDGPLKPRRAAAIVRDLAEALAYAHEHGIVHRDVKPANIMLDEEDRPHLMDFGLAYRYEVEDQLTRDGAVVGTPAYMAPEQAKGKKGEALPASDQYALGVVLYHLLTGELPFTGPTQVVLYNVVHQDPEPPRRRHPGTPRDLETICLKALAKNPEQRYASCHTLAQDLERWIEGEPIRARRMGPLERGLRWLRREPLLAG